MPKIVVKRKAEIFKEVPIRPFQNRITIGSEGDNDLIITDKKVSMHHLQIEKDGTEYYVIDTNSAFGTFVNGVKVDQKTILKSGDKISIGEHTLFFENALFEKNNKNKNNLVVEDVPSNINIPDNGGVVVEPKVSKQKSAFNELGIDTASSQQKSEYYLIAIYGPYIGKKYQLNPDVTKIGRDHTLNDIVIRENQKGEIDTSISRRHATIFFEDGSLYITDKRSKTRTRVNQQTLDEDSMVKLFPGDEIEVRSDQKSTIFRLTREGEWDYSPPKRAGDWLLRNSSLALKSVSALVILLALVIIISAFKNIKLITQSPSSMEIYEKLLFADDDPTSDTNILETNREITNSLTPAIADLNGDNINDLVYIDRLGYLFVLNGVNSQPLWPASSKYRIQFPLHIVLADLNGNKLPDIVLPARDSRIYAIDGQTGTEIWTSPLISGELSGSPVVADINGDRIKDIIFCNVNGEFYVGYGSYGEPKWNNIQTNSQIKSTPSAGDFNGDEIYEIALGTEQGEIFIFSGIANEFTHTIDVNEELQKAKGSFFEDHKIRGHIAIGDLDGDKYDDLVLSTMHGNIMAISGNGFKRIWYDELNVDENFYENMYNRISIGDLDGDKKYDVVIFTYDNKIIAYRGIGHPNGERKILWGYMPENDENFITFNPVLVDINKDGNCDVIASGSTSGIFIFNGKNGKKLWQSKQLISQKEIKPLIATPLVADLGNDGLLDIFTRRINEKFYQLVTNTRVPQGISWWNQINNDATNSSCFPVIGMNEMKYILIVIVAIITIAVLTFFNIYTVNKRKKYFAI